MPIFAPEKAPSTPKGEACRTPFLLTNHRSPPTWGRGDY